VGRAHNLALASLPHMTLPGDVSASERYGERDTVVPPFVVDSEGMVRVPAGEGIGVEVDEAFVREVEVERVEVG
jgi:O-succinylbenzoate synthase